MVAKLLVWWFETFSGLSVIVCGGSLYQFKDTSRAYRWFSRIFLVDLTYDLAKSEIHKRWDDLGMVYWDGAQWSDERDR